MHAKLDPVAKVLTNDEVITYTNNSPDNLDCLWIHLEQNTYRKDSRSSNLGNNGFGRPPRAAQTAAPAPTWADNHTEGFVLDAMDEGFNTFIDIFESDDFDHGVYGPKRDGEYSAGGNPPDTILKVLDNPDAPIILTRADAFSFVSRYSDLSASTMHSAATSANGPINIPRPPTFSARWKAKVARI